MLIKSLTTALALTGLAVTALATVSATASAAPAERYDCHNVYDGSFNPERSCTEGDARRKIYYPPPPREPQDPPRLKDWRDVIFDQAHNSGAGGDGGGGNR